MNNYTLFHVEHYIGVSMLLNSEDKIADVSRETIIIYYRINASIL